MIINKNIDKGKAFDWGKTSDDYGKYRDIYPESFFQMLHSMGVGQDGQKILDLGTGTGALPRGLYKYGANFVGVDISAEQIGMAKKIAADQGMNIEFFARPAEKTEMPSAYFDVVTACQCFLYFDKRIVLPEIVRVLKPKGFFATMWMAWLPNEDRIARQSEELVLKYNPDWNGAGYSRQSPQVPQWSKELFEAVTTISYDEHILFTQESWCGRMRACRGIGASLSEDEIAAFDAEHKSMLRQIVPDNFSILHQVIISVFRVK